MNTKELRLQADAETVQRIVDAAKKADVSVNAFLVAAALAKVGEQE